MARRRQRRRRAGARRARRAGPRGTIDTKAGALAPRLLRPDGTTEHSVHPFPGLRFTAAFALGLTKPYGDRLCLEGAWDPERARRVPWAIGAFLLLRREAFDAAGGFDERQWLFAEDLDLGWRLRRAGWATRYEPAARVEHAGSAATGAFGDERTERWQRATYAWILRRRGIAVTRLTALLNVLGALARAEPAVGTPARAHRVDDRKAPPRKSALSIPG